MWASIGAACHMMNCEESNGCDAFSVKCTPILALPWQTNFFLADRFTVLHTPLYTSFAGAHFYAVVPAVNSGCVS